MILSKLSQCVFGGPRTGSIRSKVIVSFMALSLIPLFALALFSYQAYLNILEAKVRSYTREVIDRVDRNLQIYLSDLERILQLHNDYYNLQFIKINLAGDIESNRKYTFRLWENLNNIKQFKTNLRDVSITTLNGTKIGCYGLTHVDLSQDQLFQTLANRPQQDNGIALWGSHPDWLGGEVFSVGRAIRGDYDNFLGIMSIDVEMGLLDRICRNIKLGKTGYVMVIDEDGRIIYHPDTTLIGKSVSLLLGSPSQDQWRSGFFMSPAHNGNQVITVKTFKPANWRIIGISNKMELAAEMSKVVSLSLILIIALIPAIILVAVFLANLLTRPIKDLQYSMTKAAEDLNTNVTIHSNDEVGQLGKSFNDMLARIRELMEQSVQEQKKLRRTEMIALQEQIKPHFIYNTLDLIIGLLETQKNEAVITMVEALGAFFRISLSHGQEFISIREETEHVRNYLLIQRMRHGDKYDYRVELDERISTYKTIKLILQPLVENAIYHGVRELEHGGGLITVKAFLSVDRDCVCFEVIDNGNGMEPATMEEINRCLEVAEPNQHYFGLRNVNERIGLAFGPEYGLRLFETPGGGVTVRVWLPVVKIIKEGNDNGNRSALG